MLARIRSSGFSAAAAAVAGLVAGVVSVSGAGPAPAFWRLAALVLLAGAVVAAAPERRATLHEHGRAGPAIPLALTALTVLAAALRAAELRIGPRYDETFSFLEFASRPLGEALGRYPYPNNHLLNTLLMHAGERVTDDAEMAMRGPAFLAGVALIPAVYLCGRRLHGRAVGLLAAGLVAVSAPMIEYSVNGRGYTLTWLALMLVLVLTARLVERPRAADWALWVMCASLGFYAIPTMAPGLVIAVIWFAANVLAQGRARRLVEVAVASLTTAMVSAALYAEVLGDPGWKFTSDHPLAVEAFVRSTFDAAHAGWGSGLRLLAVLGVLAGLVGHRRVARQPVPLILAAAVGVTAVALALPNPPPFERAWLFLTPVWLIAVAAGLVVAAQTLVPPRLLRPLAPAVAAVGVLALAAAFDGRDLPHGQDPPITAARPPVRLLADQRPSAQVLVSPFTLPQICFVADRLERVPLRVETRPRSDARSKVLLVSPERLETPEALARYFDLEPSALRRWRTAGSVTLFDVTQPPGADARSTYDLSCDRLTP